MVSRNHEKRDRFQAEISWPDEAFNGGIIFPESLARCRFLTPSERVCLALISTRLGQGGVFLAYATLADDLGTNKHHVRGLVAGLDRKANVLMTDVSIPDDLREIDRQFLSHRRARHG